jgi:tRNA/rRNA methyltransferase
MDLCPEPKQLLDQVTIILVRPKYAENIGSAARIAANMGVNHICVVHDVLPAMEPMLKLATHHASHLIHNLEHFNSLEEALAPYSWIVGTSARQGRQRRSMQNLKPVVKTTLPRLKENHTAFVFGPEDSGLSNEDLKLCNIIASIPTADFSSLNLAQSVAIVLYEVFSGIQEINSAASQTTPLPKQASSWEMEGIYSLIEKTLHEIEYLKETDYTQWMINIRHFLGRIGLRAREVKLIKGYCRQILRLTEKTNQGGQRDL